MHIYARVEPRANWSSPILAVTTDVVAPTFAGPHLRRETQITVSWNAATDNFSLQGSLVYDVCWSKSSAACVSSSIANETTAAGVTSCAASNLDAKVGYTFVVPDRDQDGSRDINRVTVFAVTIGKQDFLEEPSNYWVACDSMPSFPYHACSPKRTSP